MATANIQKVPQLNGNWRNPFGVSFLVHLLILAILWTASDKSVRPVVDENASKITWIEVDPLTDPKNRMVQTSPGQKVDQAPKEAFLGERNQVVDRETVSQNKVQTAARAETNAGQEKTGEQKSASRHAQPNLSKLGVALAPPPKAREIASLEQERLSAVSGTFGGPSDYVKGFKESDRTSLNTQEFVFFGYFQRIRERLDLSWNRSLKDQLGKLYKRGRTLASEMDHVTQTVVTLNAEGAVIRVQIIGESGTEDLDSAAVEAFNQAGPFPNPPRGILNATGEVKIRWDFVLRT